MAQSMILDYHKKIINNKSHISTTFNEIKKNIVKINNSHTFITTTFNDIDIKEYEKSINNNLDNLLFAVPYTLKDNITTKDILTTGGSKILQNYIPPFNATLYDLINKKQAILIGKTNLDEFGLGDSGTYSAFGDVTNFYDNRCITGGSSSGSVNAIAANTCFFSIGTDTGDSSRRPSTYLGVVGFKPSYGLISRYGVLPYAPSLDTVGIIANYVTDIAIVADAIIKFDEKDYTSQNIKFDGFLKSLKPIEKIRFSVIKDIDKYLEKNAAASYFKSIELIKKHGHIINEVEIDWALVRIIPTIYKVISCVEAKSCYANLTGITFGKNFDDISGFEKIITNNRTKGFGNQFKRRLIIGGFSTYKENYHDVYKLASKFRTLIIQQVNKLLANNDAFILPGTSSTAPLISDVKNGKFKTNEADDIVQLSNFASTPSISIPTEFIGKLPYGINISTHINDDQKLLNIALTLEEIFKFHKEVKNND